MPVVDKIIVRVDATDPISAVGATEALRQNGSLQPLTMPDNGVVADVVAVVVESIDDDALRRIREARAVKDRPVILVASTLDEESVLAAVQAGARSILWRREAGAERLAEIVALAVRGEGTVPADVLGRLLEQMGRLQHDVLAPRGMRLNGLTDREIAVLSLVAEGLETSEIARQLSYSERTIKGILHDVTTRLQLKNRTHAVAYAVREGLI